MSRFFTDYDEAQREARDLANRTRHLVRLKATKEYNQRGYTVRLVPRREKQFGCDLEGELIEPEGEECRSCL